MITIDVIPDYEHEEWREVEGYGGKYLVSNLGRIQSLKYSKPRLLTAFANNKGYMRVALCKNGKAQCFLVSRLVAGAFCENSDPENARVVDHIDGNTLNNCADNLRWVSYSDNIRNYYKKRGKNYDSSK